MRIIKTMRKQRCVYWEWTGENDQGKKTYGEPIELECRWEDVQEQFLDRMGNEQMSRARVYVDRDVVEIGVLWLPPDNIKIAPGEALSQLTSENDPFANDRAYEIRRFEKLPELRPRKGDPNNTLRTAYL